MAIQRFPKIFHLGDRYTHNIFDSEVEITEKIDGSQFNWGMFNGHLEMRSKNAPVHLNDGNKMFSKAAEQATRMFEEGLLPEGWSFHAEYLQAPKHNALAYGKTPHNYLMLYGAMNSDRVMQPYDHLVEYAHRLDVDIVPLVCISDSLGELTGEELNESLQEFIDNESALGKENMEGIVVKNYSNDLLVGGQVIPIQMGKFVSEKFKERNKVNWKNDNKGPLEKIAIEYRGNEALWNKAIQRVKEAGELEESPRDIGRILKEIHIDLDEQEKEHIKDRLWSLFSKDIKRLAVQGFPEWYKEKLIKEIGDD